MRVMRSESARPISCQLSPPSLLLYRPVPTEVELRVHGSPVPTQTVSGSCGSMRMAPMRSESSRPTFFQFSPPSVVL